VHEGVRYQYGFTALDDRFGSEWLYAWPSGSRRELFMREGQAFSFGRFLKGDNQLIARNTKANSLFVSAAAQNNHEQLGFIYGFFSKVRFDVVASPSLASVARYLGRFGLDSRALKLLVLLDTGVRNLEITDQSLDGVSLADLLPSLDMAEAGEIIQSIDDLKKFNRSVRLGHAASDGNIAFFNIEEESTGTVRLLSVLGPIFKALDSGTVVVIDELDSSLHTRACEQIMALFQSPKTNSKGAQLIATTHDTNLLNPDTLRRDQIWFTEKDGEGATHLYPLTDIHTRKGDNIEKGYL